MIRKTLLCLAFLVVASFAKVPDYIQVCGRRNPNRDECILRSIKILTKKLQEGIPELDIPPLDPFTIDRLELANMPSFTAYALNVTVYGLGNYKVNSFHFDPENWKADINLTFTELRMNSSYTVDAKILVNIQGKGNVQLSTRDINARAVVKFKLARRRGVNIIFVESMSTKLLPKDYDVMFDLEGGNKALYEGLRTVLTENHKELMEATTPNLERAVSQYCIKTGNKVCLHFTYEELFPDTE